MTDTPVPEEREPNPAEQNAASEAPAAPEPTPEASQAPAAPEPTPTATDGAAPAEPAQAEAEAPAPDGAAPAEPAQAEGDAPAPAAEQPAAPATPSRPQRPRRRRLTAAERHRRTFFAKLSELRKAEQAALAGGPEPADEPAAEATADGQPAPQEGEAPAPQQQTPEAPATSPSRSARAQARLVAAIERVGGAEAVLEALQPKRRDDGETMKWSSVCAEQAHGHRPGDPIFTAWVRLAATPVRDVKGIVNPRGRDDDRRGGRRGRGGGGGGGNYRGGGGYGGGRGDRGDRGGRGARREDIESHGRDGSFRSSVRIVMVDADGQRKETDDPQEAIEAAERVAGQNS
jgi:chemotaxis protein histidine kinase CheA